MSRPVPDYLAKLNPHHRDQFIEFDEGPHIYTVHGQQGYTSVTTWNHHHFPGFDADAIIDTDNHFFSSVLVFGWLSQGGAAGDVSKKSGDLWRIALRVAA